MDDPVLIPTVQFFSRPKYGSHVVTFTLEYLQDCTDFFGDLSKQVAKFSSKWNVRWDKEAREGKFGLSSEKLYHVSNSLMMELSSVFLTMFNEMNDSVGPIQKLKGWLAEEKQVDRFRKFSAMKKSYRKTLSNQNEKRRLIIKIKNRYFAKMRNVEREITLVNRCEQNNRSSTGTPSSVNPASLKATKEMAISASCLYCDLLSSEKNRWPALIEYIKDAQQHIENYEEDRLAFLKDCTLDFAKIMHHLQTNNRKKQSRRLRDMRNAIEMFDPVAEVHANDDMYLKQYSYLKYQEYKPLTTFQETYEEMACFSLERDVNMPSPISTSSENMTASSGIIGRDSTEHGSYYPGVKPQTNGEQKTGELQDSDILDLTNVDTNQAVNLENGHTSFVHSRLKSDSRPSTPRRPTVQIRASDTSSEPRPRNPPLVQNDCAESCLPGRLIDETTAPSAAPITWNTVLSSSSNSLLELPEETIVTMKDQNGPHSNVTSAPKTAFMCAADSDNSDDENVENYSVNTDPNVIKTVTGKVIVIKTFKKRSDREMSLKVGKIVHQSSVPKDDMAFGWMRKGKMNLKKSGFYPIDCVAALVLNNKVNIVKRGAHKVVKRAKSIVNRQ